MTDYFLLLPEIILLIVSSMGLFLAQWKLKYLPHLLAIGLLGALLVSVFMGAFFIDFSHFYYFNNMVIYDNPAHYSRIAILLLALSTMLYHWLDLPRYTPESLILIVVSLIGILSLSISNHFLSLFISLELVSLLFYALVALERDNSPHALEAAIKYFVIGTIVSALFLQGISFLYGGTGGELAFHSIAASIGSYWASNRWMLAFGIAGVTSGFLFKLGMFPFHFWLFDVYQVSRSNLLSYIAIISKLALWVPLYRLSLSLWVPNTLFWSEFMPIIGLLSMMIGTFLALRQTSLYRLLGASGMSHMGFSFVLLYAALCALEWPVSEAMSYVFFYILVYLLSSSVIWGFLGFCRVKKIGQEDYVSIRSFEDLRSLGRAYPIWASGFSVAILSLSGIPPLAGFFSKLFGLIMIMSIQWEIISLIILFLSVISAAYYLRILRSIFLEEEKDQASFSIQAPFGVQVLWWVSVLFLLSLPLLLSPLLAGLNEIFSITPLPFSYGLE